MAPVPVSSTDDKLASTSELKRYARIRRVVNDKFIEFDFAIGDPSLYVELVLPKAAFEDFCSDNQVEMMTEEQADTIDADMVKWRYGDEKLTP